MSQRVLGRGHCTSAPRCPLQGAGKGLQLRLLLSPRTGPADPWGATSEVATAPLPAGAAPCRVGAEPLRSVPGQGRTAPLRAGAGQNRSARCRSAPGEGRAGPGGHGRGRANGKAAPGDFPVPERGGAGCRGGRCHRFPVARGGSGRARCASVARSQRSPFPRRVPWPRHHERLRPGGAPARRHRGGGRAGLGGGQGFLRQPRFQETPAGECGRAGLGWGG